ncbi:unnamed protein product [Symbiodinium sp. KB8]|nr:unnamed protein product [Symbiodinium sp. KB8]
MQVRATIHRATMEMYGHLVVYNTKGKLQPGILRAFLSYPFISKVRIVEPDDSSAYQPVALTYFSITFSPLSNEGADSSQGGFDVMAEPLPGDTADEASVWEVPREPNHPLSKEYGPYGLKL